MPRVQEDKLIIKPHRPDLKEKLFFLISGVIVSIPITLLFETLVRGVSQGLFHYYEEILLIVLFAPFIEEFAKAYPLFYRHGETEKSIFVLGFLVGLGFGISEFLLYVLAYGTPVLFRLPGILFHAASASIIAYGIAKKQPVRYFSLAVGLHVFNNFSAMFEPGYIGFLIANLSTYYLLWRFYRNSSDKFID
jgi:RsiW-degrading membrane proteinase PrsW (M82 family)